MASETLRKKTGYLEEQGRVRIGLVSERVFV